MLTKPEMRVVFISDSMLARPYSFSRNSSSWIVPSNVPWPLRWAETLTSLFLPVSCFSGGVSLLTKPEMRVVFVSDSMLARPYSFSRNSSLWIVPSNVPWPLRWAETLKSTFVPSMTVVGGVAMFTKPEMSVDFISPRMEAREYSFSEYSFVTTLPSYDPTELRETETSTSLLTPSVRLGASVAFWNTSTVVFFCPPDVVDTVCGPNPTWVLVRSVTSQVPSSVRLVSTVFSTLTSATWCCGSGWLPSGTFETVASVWTTGVLEHDFPMTPTASCEAWVSVRFQSPPGVCSTRTSSPISETLTEESEVLLVTVVSVTPRRVLRITCCAVTSMASSTVVRLTSHVPSSVARACTW